MLTPVPSQDDKPLVLVLSESELYLSDLTIDYLGENSIKTELISLDKSFFEKRNVFLNQKKEIYKIVLLYGFEDCVPEFYQNVFDFISELQAKQPEKIPLVLFSSFNTTLKIIGLKNLKYEAFVDHKNTFLEVFLSNFQNSQIFLAQDIVLNNQKSQYPLLLCFSAVQQNNLLDFNNNFYFQDELSFFELIKSKLIRPHLRETFVIKGKTLRSGLVLKKIIYLYEQYFQKNLALLSFFSEEITPFFLKEATVVKNSKTQIETIIDKKIRALPQLQNNTQENTLSDRELRLASVASRKIIENKAKLKAQIPKQNPFVSNILNFFKKPQKPALTSAQEQISDDELTNKIENIFSTRRLEEKQERQDKNLEQGKQIVKKTKKRKWLFWMGLVIFIVGFSFLSLIFLFNFSQEQIQKQLFDSIKSGNKYNKNIDKSVLYSIFKFQYYNYQKFLLEESLTHAADIVKLKDSLSDLGKINQEHLKSSYDLYKKTLEGGVELEETYKQNSQLLDRRIEAEFKYNSYLMDLNLDLYQEEERLVWQKELEENKKNIASLSQIKRVMEPLEKLIRSEGRVNFMVLVQDSNEIRSSGGFLSEVIILSFESGELVDKKIISVDELSNQIYGQREAPEEIRRFLGEENYYFQDANWSADFIEVSNEIVWFVEQALGERVSFFAAINSKTILKLLEELEDIKTRDGLEINDNNYLDLLRSKALLDYQSQGDLRFSRQSISSISDRMLNLNMDQFAKVMEVLLGELNQREILLFSTSDVLQQSIEANSWGGKKTEALCPTEFKGENCLNDSFFQLESNISVNKVSSLVKRTINHDIGITDFFIRHRRKVVFENLSSTGLWPYGEYKALLKFYLNPLSQIEKIEINGEGPSQDNFFIKEGSLYDELGVVIVVPKQSRTELVITYTLENKASEDFSYVFFDQKQPGILDKNTSYKIVFDEGLIPQLVAPPANYQNKTLSYERDNIDHFLFAINFSRALSE